MKKRATIKDVAKEAGVSIALVSMVMHAKFDENGNPDCNVRKETARKVLDAVEKLKYIPNKAAAQISNGRSGIIAVITSDIASSFFSEICRQIENLAYEAGLSVIFASSDEKVEKFDNVVTSAIKLGVDGMIIVPPTTNVETMRKIEEFDIPAVFLERDIPDYAPAGRVTLDNRKACELAVQHLYDGGYRNIGQISYDMNISTIHKKDEYYIEKMNGLGLGQYAKVRKVPHAIDDNAMEKVLRTALDEGVEALFLPTKRVTLRVIKAARRMGLTLPRDLAVVGFDHSDVFDIYEPAVSYIYQSIPDLARESFTMLLEMISDHSKARHTVLEPSIVCQGSSAPKK